MPSVILFGYLYILLKNLCTTIAAGGTEHDYSVWQFVMLFVFSSLSGRFLCHLAAFVPIWKCTVG